MTGFTAAQEAALREIHAQFGHERVVLIGGAALGALTAMSWRTTRDLDLVVWVDSLAAVEDLGARPGWRRDANVRHRWTWRDVTLVDIVAVTPDTLQAGSLGRSPSGAVFDLSGLELAAAHAVEVPLSDGTSLRVAPIPAIALLKMASFLDRPHDRRRDLSDIGWMLQTYVDDFDDRRFDARLGDVGVEYHEGPAFLLGAEVRRIAAPRYVSLVEKFLSTVEGPWLDVFALQGPAAWGRDSSVAARQIRAFRHGFQPDPE